MQNLNNWQPQAGTVPVTMASAYSSEGIPTYMLGTPDAQMPNPQDSATLPMFNPVDGYSNDASVDSTGDQSGTK
jgi:hypothetical protein